MERPRVAMSGGQSGGRGVGVREVEGVVVEEVEEGEGEEGEVGEDFVMASQEATEVQERQLFLGVGFVSFTFSGGKEREGEGYCVFCRWEEEGEEEEEEGTAVK